MCGIFCIYIVNAQRIYTSIKYVKAFAFCRRSNEFDDNRVCCALFVRLSKSHSHPTTSHKTNRDGECEWVSVSCVRWLFLRSRTRSLFLSLFVFNFVHFNSFVIFRWFWFCCGFSVFRCSMSVWCSVLVVVFFVCVVVVDVAHCETLCALKIKLFRDY